MNRKYTREEFDSAVQSSTSVREVLLKIGVKPLGGNYKTFYRTALEFGTDVSKFQRTTSYAGEREKRNNIELDSLKKEVANSISYRHVLIQVDLTRSGSNHAWLKRIVSKFNIDVSHFTGQGHLKGKTHDWSVKRPTEQILVQDSQYASSYGLKMRLLKENLLHYQCNQCSLVEWQGQRLSLHLDHINGINNDNRIENLRLLCPNCHSQTSTYCNRNNRKNR